MRLYNNCSVNFNFRKREKKLYLSYWALIYLSASFFLIGCSPTVIPVKLRSEFLPPSHIQSSIPVGVFFSPHFREYQGHEKVNPGVCQGKFIVPLGESSVSLFKNRLSTIFTRSEQVGSRRLSSSDHVQAILEPSIENFDLECFSRGSLTFLLAQIHYRITVFTSQGSIIATWSVKGMGEMVASPVASLDKSIANLVELALRDADEQLQNSFVFVPEAKSWLQHLPPHNAFVNLPAPTITGIGQISQTYPGIASITAALNPSKSGVLGVDINLKNEGKNRLVVQPGEIAISLEDGRNISPVSLVSLAEKLIPPNSYSGYPPMWLGLAPIIGPGPAAALTLIESLIAAHEQASQEDQVNTLLSSYRQEKMRNVILWEGEPTSYHLNYIIPDDANQNLKLMVPIVDIDSMREYKIEIEKD